MKPIDYRNANWHYLQSRIQGDRLAVFSAWRQHGPGTTKELAEKSGMDILSFRPRTTELVQLGFVILLDEFPGKEGTYRALSDGEAWELFRTRQEQARDPQIPLL